MAAPAVVAAVVSCVLDDDDDGGEFDVRNIQAAMYNVEHPMSNGTDVDAEIFRNLRDSGGHFMVFSRGADQETMDLAIRGAEAEARVHEAGSVGSSTYRRMLDCPPLTRDCPVAATIATATKSWGQYNLVIQMVPAVSLEIVGQLYDYTVVRIDTAWSQSAVNQIYARLLAIHDRMVLSHRYRDIDYITMASSPMFHPESRFPPRTTKPSVSCSRWGMVFVHPGIVARLFGHGGMSIKNKTEQVRKLVGKADGQWCQQPMAIPVKGSLSGVMMIALVGSHMRHMSSWGCKQYIREMYSYVMSTVRFQIYGIK